MPTNHSLDRPAWDQLCTLTTSWLLAAQSPAEERAIWAMKVRAYRLYHHARSPEDMARRLLGIISKAQQQSRAA
jgi:hypothetical protein